MTPWEIGICVLAFVVFEACLGMAVGSAIRKLTTSETKGG